MSTKQSLQMALGRRFCGKLDLGGITRPQASLARMTLDEFLMVHGVLRVCVTLRNPKILGNFLRPFMKLSKEKSLQR